MKRNKQTYILKNISAKFCKENLILKIFANVIKKNSDCPRKTRLDSLYKYNME